MGSSNVHTPAAASVVPISNDNTVSTNNSTTTALGIDANFTGTGDDCLGYSSITTQLFADQDSATDGMTFQFSTDNVNWDETHLFTMTASDTRHFQFPAHARYFRINYTNGGTGQGAFRVQTILHRQTSLTTIHRLVDNTSPDRSAQVVKAAIIAQAAGSGDFIPVQSTAGGNLKISLEECDGALCTATQADGLANTTDGVNTTTFNYWYNGATWDRARGTLADGLLVNLGANNDVTLAANSSVNVAQIAGTATSVTSGNKDNGTQRVILADDDPAVTLLGTIDSDTSTLAGAVAAGQMQVDIVADGAGLATTALQLAAGHTVAILDGGGTALTSTLVGADQSLDVNLTQSVALAVTGTFWQATQPVSAAALPLPAGAATSAKQLADGHNVTIDNGAAGAAVNIQDGGNTITVDGTVTATATNLDIRDLSKTQDDVLIYANTVKDGSGTDLIPLVDADGHVQVDVLSGGGGGTQYTLGTDTYAETTTIATMAGAVRKDAAGTLVGTDNELSPFQLDANGNLRVTGGGGGTEYIQDEVVTDPATASTFLMARDDALTTQEDADNDWTVPRANARGAQWVELDLTNEVTTDLTSIGTNAVNVNGGNRDTGTQTVTLADDDPAVASLGIMDDWDNTTSDGASVTGNVAHDGADAGEPVKLGANTVAMRTDPAEVSAANDITDVYATRAGQLWTLPGHPNQLTKSWNITDGDGAQTDLNLLAGVVAATDVCVVMGISVNTDAATTAGTQCRIGFGAANTPAADGAAVIVSASGIPPGGGQCLGFGGGIVGMGAEGEELRMTCEDPTGGAIDVVVSYFIISDS